MILNIDSTKNVTKYKLLEVTHEYDDRKAISGKPKKAKA